MEEKQQKNEISLLKLFFLFFFIGSFTIGGGSLMLLIFTRIHPLMLIALGAAAGTVLYL